MMDKKTIEMRKLQFDDILHIYEGTDVEFWYAREQMELLGYDTWRSLLNMQK